MPAYANGQRFASKGGRERPDSEFSDPDASWRHQRESGRLKGEWALAPLRVRRIERVRLHTDLTILAKLSCALGRSGVQQHAA